jgi:hypothetical protein
MRPDMQEAALKRHNFYESQAGYILVTFFIKISIHFYGERSNENWIGRIMSTKSSNYNTDLSGDFERDI